MSPLYLFNNKLLVRNNKLAHSIDCCCVLCKIDKCGCYEHQYRGSYTKLWQDIQDWINNEGHICNNVPVNCGQWKPKFINGVPQRDCCSKACYDIWDTILLHVGYDQNTIDITTPNQFDSICGEIIVRPTVFPTDNTNPDKTLFDNISYNDRYFVTSINTKNKIGKLGDECLPDTPDNTFSSPINEGWAPVDFITLQGGDKLAADIDSNALELFKTGSCLPHEKIAFYDNAEECRNCYGALYKLGTFDLFGRTVPNTDFMTGVLINANDGNIQTDTDFSISTKEKLTPVECISKKFSGGDVDPYGILTNQLKYSIPLINTESSDLANNQLSYFTFDLKYEYEITWDDPEDESATWTPFTNKWVGKYGPQSSNSPALYFEDDENNYYQSDIIGPLGGSISSLDFDPETISTTMSIKWNNPGVLIGENTCGFSENPLMHSRLPPTLSVTSNSGGTGCSFTPVLLQLSEPNGKPYWTIQSVSIGGTGSGYVNDEALQINIANEDIEEDSGSLQLKVSATNPYPEVGAEVDFSPISPAVLGLSYTKYQNDPVRWHISNISITDPGDGYDDGVYDIIFSPNTNTIQETASFGKAVTERIVPAFSVNLVTSTGSNADINLPLTPVTNANGQKAWIFDYFICDQEGFFINNGGTGYLSTDYLEISLIPPYSIDTDYAQTPEYVLPEYSPGVWRVPLSVDENGSIYDINDGYIFYTQPFFQSTGKIEAAILTSSLYGNNCGHTYPNDTPNGSYYKESNTGTPTSVVVIDGGKYYNPNVGTIRKSKGPCIDNIKMDIWHPGPCGISEELKDKTGANTSWDGYYYGNLKAGTYQKFWVYTAFSALTFGEKDNCPCCILTKFVLGVVKLEGCENGTIRYNQPVKEWQIRLEACDQNIAPTVNPDIKIISCQGTQYYCCEPSYYCTDGTVVNGDCTIQQISFEPITDSNYVFANGSTTCIDLKPNVYPENHPDYWQYCPVITKNTPPWAKTDTNCP